MPLDPEETATTARDLMLDRMWATAPGALVEVGLLNGDPSIGGTELDVVDCPGYARHTVSTWAGFWSAAVDGSKSSAAVTFGAPTDVWNDAGSWDCIYVDGYAFDAAELVDPVVVTAAGDPVTATLVRAFSDSVG